MRDMLPAEILARRKMGFPVPVGTWFRGPHRAIVNEFVLSERAAGRGLFRREAVERLVATHMSGAEKHDERLWMLVNWEIWQRIFLDGEAPEQIRWR
jgi:asparagine synthase (glutamine-hydrolysing)